MKNADEKNPHLGAPFTQTYFHGTKANLKIGDFIGTGFTSNYENRKLRHVYVTSTLNTASLGAELATGDAPPRIYVVEPTGEIEDDPNVTDKKFPGNPTMSYRSEHPFKVIGEVILWQGRSSGEIKAIRDGLEKLRQLGKNIILD
ncbi:NAD(+)--rifampin ADP-ribosyltransferase [Flavobacterium pallidum]|uniref:NAD(+)--rifampin ADP-ribosyltransferase n=1 Tax=Flavobacterium pallidum TaxID=2172098 RepID=A0A2S1SK89_9FLAO|nr:NAD(+)--rifampin ADP-ribosyltransferase [Flavobacterium pallidum]AWI26782.1 NAD(+)--rifampin ADP-ribosyltransferase [Flavobacterium pallidum]